ncbi:MAG: DNA-deoxyinosine glycosylase [Firmicutes bacterium]|nr:DNA-deoxyinosine glycosylase [Bacillota bacterium]
MGKRNEYTRVVHTIAPVFNEDSKILVLGSLPSVKSREGQFFYHHKQNRFWKVIAAVTNCDEPKTIDDKKDMLLKNGIALWDVISQCDIISSSDATIKNVTANDLSLILSVSKIEKVFVNGGTAFRLYEKYCKNESAKGMEAVKLPSTSAANASYSLERLIEAWKVIYSE